MSKVNILKELEASLAATGSEISNQILKELVNFNRLFNTSVLK